MDTRRELTHAKGVYERILYRIFSEEVARLVAQPDAILSFFEGFPFCLTRAEAERTRDAFVAKPPMVIQGFPRQGNITFPLYAITLEAEHETQQFLSAAGGTLTPEQITELNLPGRNYGIQISTMKYKYAVMSMADGNADQAIYMYHLSKFFIAKRRDDLLGPSAFDIDRSGRELLPDPAYLPSSIYIRSMSLSFQAEEAVLAELDGVRVSAIAPVRILGAAEGGGIQLGGRLG